MLVVIASLLLIALTGAAYTYMRSSGSTYQWTKEQIQAKLTAESGAHLAIHMILGGADIPQGTSPEWFLGDKDSWYQLPDPLGEVVVSVDPNDANDEVLSANAYEIRSMGRITALGGVRTFGFVTGMMPENMSRFSVFQHNPGDNVYIGDGFVFDGPYYANGSVRIWSESATHTNDPYFYSFTTTAPYFLYGTNSTLNPPQVSTPEYGNLQIQPINRHLMGEPWFTLNADPIPYGSGELNWESAMNAALSGGIMLDYANNTARNGMRMVLRQDTLMVQLAPLGAVTNYYLGDLSKPVIWVRTQYNTDTIYLKGYSNLRNDGLNMALTMGTNCNFALAGSILYEDGNPQNPDNKVILGLLAVYGNMLIARPSSINTNWDPRFYISTIGDIEVNAVVVSLDGMFQAELQPVTEPTPRRSMFLLGGFMYQRKGPTARNDGTWHGHDVQIYFDPRLMTMHPPYFPNNGRWHNLYWEERPSMDLDFMMTNAL